MAQNHNQDDKHSSNTHHHHILSNKTAVLVGGTLLFLTVITVWIAGFDFGSLNFPIAMLVATIKALLVTLFFMNLLYDRRENAVIFGASFLFLAIFIVLTATDLFFRGDVYVKPGDGVVASAQARSKLEKPWESTPALVGRGQELYAQQCASCHGGEGRGDGPAAGSFNPAPRNFHATEGWKNGRKVTEVFKTLKEGIPNTGMGSFATLPPDDRWAIAHFVRSFMPSPPEVAAADIADIATGAGAEEVKTIPVDVAIELMVREAGNQ